MRQSNLKNCPSFASYKVNRMSAFSPIRQTKFFTLTKRLKLVIFFGCLSRSSNIWIQKNKLLCYYLCTEANYNHKSEVILKSRIKKQSSHKHFKHHLNCNDWLVCEPMLASELSFLSSIAQEARCHSCKPKNSVKALQET